eukprot:380337-Amphidinium_carterae.1
MDCSPPRWIQESLRKSVFDSRLLEDSTSSDTTDTSNQNKVSDRSRSCCQIEGLNTLLQQRGSPVKSNLI